MFTAAYAPVKQARCLAEEVHHAGECAQTYGEMAQDCGSGTLLFWVIHSYGQPEVDKGLKRRKSAAQTFGELLSFRKDTFRLKTTLNGNLECDSTVLPCFKGGGGG